MKTNRARIYDILSLLTVIVVITLDQWTKALVVEHLSPPESGNVVPLIGNYLVLDYIQNRGAAFGMFANTLVLTLLIAVAIAVIVYLYLRILNTGPLVLKLIFGMIIGGAAGNLIDRIHHGGYVVDFIYFSISQIGFHFAVFNLADASISVGVFLLFVYVLISGLRGSNDDKKLVKDGEGRENSASGAVKHAPSAAANGSGTLRSGEQDV